MADSTVSTVTLVGATKTVCQATTDLALRETTNWSERTMGNSSKTNLHPNRLWPVALSAPSRTVAGAMIGGLCALTYGLVHFLQAWSSQTATMVYLGAPQGSDQYVYMAINQAIWRAGNGLTYAYPFTVPPDATPPILLHLPFVFTSGLGLLVGLPLAYEILRVAGGALAGAMIALLSAQLSPSRPGRRAMVWVALLGGGWFWVKGAQVGIQEAGVEGLSILPDWYQLAAGPFYYWLPNLLPNFRLPIEPLNHGLVFGVLWGIGNRRQGVALAFGLLAWLTNPFPGLVSSMVGGGVAALALFQSFRQSSIPRTHRAPALRGFLAWVGLTALALAYYGPFQSQWPDLAEVSRMHRLELGAPPSVADMLYLMGPWILGLAAIPQALSTNSQGLRRPLGAALAVMAVGQILLQTQSWYLGNRAFQPYHFNRGYLGLSLAGLLVLALPAWIRYLRHRFRGFRSLRKLIPRTRARAVVLLTVLTAPDTVLFVAKDFLRPASTNGLVPRDLAACIQTLREVPGAPRLIHQVDLYNTLPVAAMTPHVPYNSSHWIAFPFSLQRAARLNGAYQSWKAGQTQKPLEDLGITLALLPTDSADPWEEVVRKGGWQSVVHGRLTLWVSPEVKAFGSAQRAP